MSRVNCILWYRTSNLASYDHHIMFSTLRNMNLAPSLPYLKISPLLIPCGFGAYKLKCVIRVDEFTSNGLEKVTWCFAPKHLHHG
jgi:hypothetical protein